MAQISDEVLIIAEAGVNHNGSVDKALELVDAASIAGADVVKFQTYKTENLVSDSAPKANYQLANTQSSESQFEMLRKLELSHEMYQIIIDRCQEKKIKFASTGFDEESVNLLIGLGVDFLKVPSGEITNFPLLKLIGSKGLPIFLSTGMSTMQEVKDALAILVSAGAKESAIVVLHCTTEYPTPMDNVNLRAMVSIAAQLGTKVGYSDHTLGIEVPIAAVAMGAKIIEKHFTMDRNMEGPDHAASLEPHELKQMVSSIRNIENALGEGQKRPTKSEKSNIDVIRKSIVAKTNIKAGEMFTENNLCVKRPGTGISPMRWDELVDSKAIKDFKAGKLISI